MEEGFKADNNENTLGRVIAQKIEDGSYYMDARDWYFHKYVSPVIERSFFIVITSISLSIAIIALNLMIEFLPLTIPVPTITSIKDMATETIKISPIGRKSDEPNLALIKKLTIEYVYNRERYDYSTLGAQLSIMKRFSSPAQLKRYTNYMSIRNPKSPVLKYYQETRRIIEINNWTYRLVGAKKGEGYTPNLQDTVVNFSATETNIYGEQTTKWRAKISFDYNKLHFDKKTKQFSPLKFVVKRYNLTQLD